ncbi:hypothetical protein [Hymenobacter terricola]|uniref:hypothetical protein n=1 Tax=Hymenobacter terricola TaxID=2819236 RepID=UPI001B3183FB|nr:hypothetical protein [Hymenobacter terricola]
MKKLAGSILKTKSFLGAGQQIHTWARAYNSKRLLQGQQTYARGRKMREKAQQNHNCRVLTAHPKLAS